MAKVAMIGAGSIGFTRRLMMDVLAVPELRDTEFRFMDISEENLEMTANLCRKMIQDNDLPSRVIATTDQKEALRGADYVLSTVRVGGLEAFAHDIEIPLKYGVDQCVGDTLGPGGVFYALRTIPVLLEIARDMREVCPHALLLNYSNPMAMNTWALRRAGGVRVVGLCHGVQGGAYQIATALGIPLDEMEYICAGINHQTWFIKVMHEGRDLTGKVPEAFKSNQELMKGEPLRIDVMERLGYYSTESNGHLSEYLPWYRKQGERKTSTWITRPGMEERRAVISGCAGKARTTTNATIRNGSPENMTRSSSVTGQASTDRISSSPWRPAVGTGGCMNEEKHRPYYQSAGRGARWNCRASWITTVFSRHHRRSPDAVRRHVQGKYQRPGDGC